MKPILTLKSHLICLITFVFISISVQAQLPDGAIAPDWDVTDLNGNDHDFDDYMADGKHIIIDFGTTWCSPCWLYHQQGTLDDIYHDYGPNGTDDLMVFLFEGDTDTNDACLYGDTNNCSSITLGNWVSGTSYPIVNLEGSQEVTEHEIGYWPTLYIVNGDDGRIWEMGQASYSQWENLIFESFTLEASYEVMPGVCEVGEITVEASGGYGSLAYSWSNGDSGQTVTVPSGSYDVSVSDNFGYFVVLEDIQIYNDETPFDIEYQEIEHVECYGEDGGSIFVDFETTDDLEYEWSNGEDDDFNGDLESGTYYLTVYNNDNGCVEEFMFEIEEPDEIELDLVVLNSSCGLDNGAIEAFAEGGVGTFYFDFGEGLTTDNTIENLGPGFYTVIAEDFDGCQHFETIEIESSEGLVTTVAIGMELNCVNTQTNVTVEVNTLSEVVYTWTNAVGDTIFTGIESNVVINNPGQYYVHALALDDNCESTTGFDILGDYQTEEIVLNGVQDLDCLNASIPIDLILEDSLMIYEISWSYLDATGMLVEVVSDVFEVEAPGSYSVSLLNTTNGCVSAQSFEIGFIDNDPIADFEIELDLDVLTVNMTALGENLDAQWSLDGVPVELDSDGNIIFEENGTYDLCLTVTNECGSDTYCTIIEVTDILSSTSELTINDLEVHALGDRLVINSASSMLGQSMLQLFDMEGKLLSKMNLNLHQGENVIDLQNYPSGIYIVYLNSSKGELTEKLFISN